MRLQIVGRIQSPTVNYQTVTDEWKLRKVEAVGRNLKWLCKFTRPVVDSLIISSLNEVERSNFRFLIPLASNGCLRCHDASVIAVWTGWTFQISQNLTWKIVNKKMERFRDGHRFIKIIHRLTSISKDDSNQRDSPIWTFRIGRGESGRIGVLRVRSASISESFCE